MTKKIFFPFVLFLSFSLPFFCGSVFFILNNKWVDFSALEHYNPSKPTILLDDSGVEWTRFELDRREPVSIDLMPNHLINAFIAAEDWAFFKHYGLSMKGILRSFFVNLYKRRRAQGASTITQQLVRLLFLSPSKTFRRKIKEQIYAILVEKQFSKEQILETYLNHVYLGGGIYGVGAASQRFWGKDAQDLTLDEAAVISSVVRSPSNYCPLFSLSSAEKGRNRVLGQMLKLKFITKEEYEYYKRLPVKLIEQEKNSGIAPHLKETIRVFLEDLVGRDKLYCGGLKVQTTINLKMQKCVEESFADHINKLRNNHSENIDGGLITIDVKSGEIKSLVGGLDFKKSKFNRALQAKRQLGSIFKPIVFAAALEKGMSFADTDIDEPLQIIDGDKIWAPQNHTHKFEGRMTLARALSISNNIVTIKTILKAGIKNVINLAKKFRLNAVFNPYPSLALGCIDVTVKDAVGMFNVFANNGVYVEPHFIKWVKNEWGQKIWKVNIDSEKILEIKLPIAKITEKY